MAKPSFYNDNRFRAYPFLRGELGQSGSGTVENVSNNSIVDVGFTMGLNSGYVAGEHDVWLYEVSRSGDTMVFRFRSNAPGLINRPIEFSRDVADEEYTTEFVDNLSEAYIPVSDSVPVSQSYSYDGDDECDVEPLWSGFLVTGRLVDIYADISDGQTWSGSAIVEPGVVDSMADSYVATLNLGNADRTRVTAPDGCPEIDWAYPVGEDVTHINQTCLQGDVRFKAGYNTTVTQLDLSNQIVIAAEFGAGEGVPCDEIALFDEETPPDGSTLFEGGPRCDEVLRSISGLGGPLLNLLTGPGVEITSVPDENKLIIDVNMRGLAVCYDDVSDVSEVI